MSEQGVVVVLQARMGSQRLAGKSMMTVAGRSLVWHAIARLQRAGAGPVILATTTLAEDDPLAEEGARAGAALFRGSPDDVLGRMCDAAAASAADVVVRATGDNPAVDADSIGRLVPVLRAGGFDHAVEEGLPEGTTVEVMRLAALQAVAARATRRHDREHVTPYLRTRGNGFRSVSVAAPPPLHRPDLRFTVDTPADLAYMREVLARAGEHGHADRTVSQLIAAADAVALAGRWPA